LRLDLSTRSALHDLSERRERRLKLLSRPECHLCDVASRHLTSLGIAFDTIDVDKDEALASRYGDWVPVLLDGDVEVVRAPFTLPSLRKAIARAKLTL
jgi:glutaredoxin